METPLTGRAAVPPARATREASSRVSSGVASDDTFRLDPGADERPDDLAIGTAKIIVVMPALNAGSTLADTVEAIPRDLVDEVILVDDKSTDNTLDLARQLPIHVIWHPHNVGYGGNQKTCYLEALQRGADIVVMLHPDGQYEPSLIPDLVRPILNDEADLVLGSRFAVAGMALQGGMPKYKFLANRALTTIENWVLGTKLSEMHTGYRAYSRRLLLTVPFLRNSIGFSFDSELIMQAVHFGLRVTEVPARTRYFAEASSISFGDSVVYGIKTLAAAGRLLLHRAGMRSRKFQA
jgi:glycosyltransferase involved in cell wall biosynthesis